MVLPVLPLSLQLDEDFNAAGAMLAAGPWEKNLIHPDGDGGDGKECWIGRALYAARYHIPRPSKTSSSHQAPQTTKPWS